MFDEGTAVFDTGGKTAECFRPETNAHSVGLPAGKASKSRKKTGCIFYVTIRLFIFHFSMNIAHPIGHRLDLSITVDQRHRHLGFG